MVFFLVSVISGLIILCSFLVFGSVVLISLCCSSELDMLCSIVRWCDEVWFSFCKL